MVAVFSSIVESRKVSSLRLLVLAAPDDAPVVPWSRHVEVSSGASQIKPRRARRSSFAGGSAWRIGDGLVF